MRILVIRFSSLGDVVLATAPLHALVDTYSEAEITVATKSEYAPLFDGIVPSVRVLSLGPGQSLKAYTAQLGQERFDQIVDLHGSLRSRLLCARLNSKHTSRINKQWARRLRMVWSKKGLERPISVLQNYLEAAGFGASNQMPHLSLTASETASANQLPSAIGIGWGAEHATKVAPGELWNRVLERLPEVKSRVIRVYGLDSDRNAIADFAKSRPNSEINAHIGLSLREVMCSLTRCTVFMSSDSGLMHMASALGVPTAGFFGPTHPSLGFAPAGPNNRAFHSGIWCSPCHRHGNAPCFREERHCFSTINDASVAQWVLEAHAARES